jgi:hypothetical protein
VRTRKVPFLRSHNTPPQRAYICCKSSQLAHAYEVNVLFTHQVELDVLESCRRISLSYHLSSTKCTHSSPHAMYHLFMLCSRSVARDASGRGVLCTVILLGLLTALAIAQLGEAFQPYLDVRIASD